MNTERPEDLEAANAMRRLQTDFMEMDQRRFDVIISDIRIEREIDKILRQHVTPALILGKLGYRTRLDVLRELATDAIGKNAAEAAVSFHTLRNAAAHGLDDPTFDARAATVRGQVGALSGVTVPETAHLGTVAIALLGALHVAFEPRVSTLPSP